MTASGRGGRMVAGLRARGREVSNPPPAACSPRQAPPELAAGSAGCSPCERLLVPAPRREEPEHVPANDGFEARVDVELAEEATDVVPRGLLRDAEPLSDRRGPEAFGEKCERLVLPRRQLGCGGRRGARLLTVAGAGFGVGEPERPDDLAVLPERDRRDSNAQSPAVPSEQRQVVLGVRSFAQQLPRKLCAGDVEVLRRDRACKRLTDPVADEVNRAAVLPPDPTVSVDEGRRHRYFLESVRHVHTRIVVRHRSDTSSPP